MGDFLKGSTEVLNDPLQSHADKKGSRHSPVLVEHVGIKDLERHMPADWQVLKGGAGPKRVKREAKIKT